MGGSQASEIHFQSLCLWLWLCLCLWLVYLYLLCALCMVYVSSAVDRLRIHFDDSHFVFRWISYKYVFFRYFCCCCCVEFVRALLLLLLEINHFGFYAFSPWAFSGFPFWTEFRLYLIFFPYTFFESLETHFIRRKKKKQKQKKNKKIKKIRPRFIKWMTSHHLSVDVCFFPRQCLWHATFLDGSRAFRWTCFIVHCLLAGFSCMWEFSNDNN